MKPLQAKGFVKTVSDIESLKIQGAENVAKEAAKSLRYVMKACKDCDTLIMDLTEARKRLFATRPTEPCMRNTLNFVLWNIEKRSGDAHQIANYVEGRIAKALELFSQAEDKITSYGAEKIKEGYAVYTHCHSSTVTRTIIAAWEQDRHIEAHNTETRPRFQGRLTAKELAAKGIPVSHYADSAMRFAIRNSDLVLLGADAITAEGVVVNKVGSGLVTEVAARMNIPVYICTNSWKFDPATITGAEEPIEKREDSEVWDKAPKGVKIQNFAFEQIEPQLITGIITELGIYKPKALANAIKKNYPWMFAGH
jgi:ribose 1,5-bisphosphate isomerase